MVFSTVNVNAKRLCDVPYRKSLGVSRNGLVWCYLTEGDHSSGQGILSTCVGNPPWMISTERRGMTCSYSPKWDRSWALQESRAGVTCADTNAAMITCVHTRAQMHTHTTNRTHHLTCGKQWVSSVWIESLLSFPHQQWSCHPEKKERKRGRGTWQQIHNSIATLS